MTHLLALALGLLACSDEFSTPTDTDTPSETDTTPSETDTTPTDRPTTDTGAPTDTDVAHTGSGGTHSGTAVTDTATVGDLASLVPGTWRPVSITQGGNTTPLPNDPATYLLLDASGSLALGCGTAPVGTWAFDPYGPYPSIGVIEVDLGFPVSWYVLTLDPQTLVYVEGGDQFDFARDACP